MSTLMNANSVKCVCFKIISVLSTFQSLRLLDPKLFPYSDSVCDSWFSPWLIRIAFNLTNLKLILISENKWWLPPIISFLHLARNFVIKLRVTVRTTIRIVNVQSDKMRWEFSVLRLLNLNYSQGLESSDFQGLW